MQITMKTKGIFVGLLIVASSSFVKSDDSDQCTTAGTELVSCLFANACSFDGASCVIPLPHLFELDCTNVVEECSHIRMGCGCPKCHEELLRFYQECDICPDLDCEGVDTINVEPRKLPDCQVASGSYINCLIANIDVTLACQSCPLELVFSNTSTCGELESTLCNDDCCDECKPLLVNTIETCELFRGHEDCGCDFSPSAPTTPSPAGAPCVATEVDAYQICMTENSECSLECNNAGLADAFATLYISGDLTNCGDLAEICVTSSTCCPACHDAFDKSVGCLGFPFIGAACDSCTAAVKGIITPTPDQPTPTSPAPVASLDNGGSSVALIWSLIWPHLMMVIGLLVGVMGTF